MLAIRLPEEIEERLKRLAKRTGRTTSYYVRQAILEHLEDLEDVEIADKRLAKLSARERRERCHCRDCCGSTGWTANLDPPKPRNRAENLTEWFVSKEKLTRHYRQRCLRSNTPAMWSIEVSARSYSRPR